jgi:hypothetical protein
VEGQLLVVTNSASDPDIPTNRLTFSLGTNSPIGMTIDSTNGLISWTPSEAQGPATNVVTVLVTDDGSPPLAASRDFTVIVIETNSAPTLASIADRMVHAGTSVVVSNSATDADLPTNTLSFSLGAGAPAVATIDSATGRFAWQTGSADVNTTNHVHIIVSDNGIPNLTDDKAFDIIVLERPILTPSAGTNQTVNLLWTAISGQHYSLQVIDNITGTNWVDLSGVLTSSGPTMQTNDVINGASQRFYRVKVLP